MNRLKIPSSKELMVFIGGLNVIDPILEDFAVKRSAPLKKTPKELMDEMRRGLPEIIESADVTQEEEKKAIQKLRVQIVDMLNKSGEVREIHDMFKEPQSPTIDFNPLVFVMHLPLSLQRLMQEERDRAQTEDFLVVYDARIIMVGAVCSSEERPWGAYDVRDKLLQMMRTLVPSVKMTTPCLTHEAIVFTRESIDVKDSRDIYVKIDSHQEAIDILRNLYEYLSLEILSFYGACESSIEATGIVLDLEDCKSELLRGLKAFLTTNWRHPLRRGKFVRQMKKKTVEILEKLADYSSSVRDTRESVLNVEQLAEHNSLFKRFIDNVGLKEYTTPEAADPEALMRIIEHVRCETESYSSFVSTLISALAGAIIGSALTILISYFLGFL